MRRDVDDWDLMQALRLDSGIGPARPIDDATAAAIVGGAIERAFGGGGGGGAGSAGGAARGGGFGAKALAGLATATAVAVTAWFLLRPDERIDRAASVPMPVAIIEADAAPVVVPEAAAMPEPVAAPEPEPALAPRHRAEKPERKPEKPAKPEKKEHRSVEDLMAAANAARKHKEWQRADDLYLEVVKDHAQSPSAQVALVASATLHLEHLGDPRGAMKRFRAAIGRVSGPLAEEARYGLAEAYRALGDRAAEAKALDEFLDEHGDSPLADRARERRGELP